MTSTKISEACRAAGHTIAPDTVRRDWARGAPRGSAEAYLRWRDKHTGKSARGDPDIKAARLKLVLEQTELTRIRKEAEEIELAQTRGELWKKSEVIAAYKSTLARSVRSSTRSCALTCQPVAPANPPRSSRPRSARL